MSFLRGGLVGFVACAVLAATACNGDAERSDDDASDGGYHPPDRHVQGCTRLCEREAEAMCPNETTFEKCVEDCNDGILLEACAGAWDPVLDCVLSTDVVGCSAEGTAVLPECIPPYLTYLDCVSTNG